MQFFLMQFIPMLIILGSFCVPIPVMLWIRHQRKGRKNPLTADMLRAPGESISERIKQLDNDLDCYFFMLGVMPLSCYATYLSTRAVGSGAASPTVFVIMTIVVLIILGLRMSRLLKRRHSEQLGLDCERAVGQELNQLMSEGCRVYHDFQAGSFNIDHIVVGENGILAIETKGRAKPDRGRGTTDAQVICEGGELTFPTWTEREPITQAKRQAEWLTKWLTDAVGERVVVRPGLALPGWWVERKDKDFLVFSGRNLQFLAKVPTETPLSPSMVQRVVHQIEQRCRDVKPLAYKQAANTQHK